MTDRCEHCRASITILCERAPDNWQTVAEDFACPKCGAQLHRELSGPLVEVRRNGLA